MKKHGETVGGGKYGLHGGKRRTRRKLPAGSFSSFHPEQQAARPAETGTPPKGPL